MFRAQFKTFDCISSLWGGRSPKLVRKWRFLLLLPRLMMIPRTCCKSCLRTSSDPVTSGLKRISGTGKKWGEGRGLETWSMNTITQLQDRRLTFLFPCALVECYREVRVISQAVFIKSIKSSPKPVAKPPPPKLSSFFFLASRACRPLCLRALALRLLLAFEKEDMGGPSPDAAVMCAASGSLEAVSTNSDGGICSCFF